MNRNKNFVPNRIIHLEAYRGIAALGVALSHYIAASSRDAASAEYAAIIFVEMFFPLSGFILAPQVIKVVNDYRHLPIFFARRWMRTIPLYVLGLILMATISYQIGSEQFYQYLFFYHFFLADYSVNNFYPIAWSLAAEEAYYIAAPIACLLLPFKDLWKRVAVFIAIGVVISFYLALTTDSSYVRVSTLARVDSIGIGFLLYLWKDRIHPKWILLFTPVALAALFIHHTFNTGLTSFAFAYAMNIYFGLICIGLYKHEYNNQISSVFYKEVSEFIGSISYTVYVLHLFILAVCLYSGIGTYIYLVLTILCSYFVHVYMELRILRMRPKYRRRFEEIDGNAAA